MDISPFPYHGPLAPSQVAGRDDLLLDLTERVTERRVTALLGPRRFGKTSVLRRLAHDLTETATVTVDLFGCASWSDLATRFAESVQMADVVVRKPTTDVALSLGFDLGVVRGSVTRSPTKAASLDKDALSAIVRGLTQAADATPLLLVLDEFQAITRVPDAAHLLRTLLQHHFQDLGLVFSGSEPSAMQDLFSNREQPFYNQADVVTIGPLERVAVRRIVHDGFAATGRDAGSVDALIHAHTGGHPQRTMQTADAVWRLAGHAPAEAVWAGALDRLRHSEQARLTDAFDQLSANEQRLVRLVASGLPLFGRDAERLELSSGSAQHAKKVLLADATIREEGDAGLVVTDPYLADWIRVTLPA